jgi:hypothetical protein
MYETEIGHVYGRLTVERFVRADKHGKYYECLCGCGNRKIIRIDHITSGLTLSCGCLLKEIVGNRMRKHGEFGTRLYRIWASMKNRCYNTKQQNYKWYGGRGITVCDEWLNDYVAFRDWALSHGYLANLSIDRIKNDENYIPDNCRWVTMKEQANNRRSNRVD